MPEDELTTEEARARIAELHASKIRAIAEARKARAEGRKAEFERLPWKQPTTYLLLLGGVVGIVSAAVQWQRADLVSQIAAREADLAAERAGFAKDKLDAVMSELEE